MPKRKAAADSSSKDDDGAACLARAKVLGAVSSSFTKDELVELGCFAYCLKSLQSELLVSFLEEHDGGPLLIQYSQDTTPLGRRQNLGPKQASVLSRKSFKQAGDVLVQQVYISAPVGNGKMQHALLHGPPLPVSYGKTTRALAAFAHFCPGLMAVQPSCMNYRLRHVVVDRGVPTDVGHYISGVWASSGMPRRVTDALAEEAGDEHEHYELHTLLHCCAHDCHTALKWSQATQHEDAQLLTNAFVALSSRRACLSACLAGLSSWLCEVLEFVPQMTVGDYSHEEQLWAIEIFAAWLTSSTRDEIAKLKTAVIRKSCRKFKAGQAKVLRPEGRKRKAKDADIQAEDAAKALLGI